MENARIILICLISLSLLISGCTNPVYTYQIDVAYSRLQLGMTIKEVDSIFKKATFLKEQAVILYPNGSEGTTRRSLKTNNIYKDIYPSNLVEIMPLDGSIKVNSYLEKKVLNWPNGTFIHYIAVFYDTKTGKIVGWAKLSTSLPLENWSDRF